MGRTLGTLLLGLALLGCAGTTNTSPPSDDAARLETSPRHHEWIDVDAGGRTVRAFVAFPERTAPGPAVLLIHENRGLNTWARETADRLAEHGYLTIAPDLLSGTGPGGGGTEAFADSDAARTGIYALPPAQVTADLEATLRAVRDIPACDGRVAVVGFCWGGSQTFRFATTGASIGAACVFYGTAPDDPSVFPGIGAPVHGFLRRQRRPRERDAARDRVGHGGRRQDVRPRHLRRRRTRVPASRRRRGQQPRGPRGARRGVGAVASSPR